MPGKLTYFVILLVPGLILNLTTWAVWFQLLRPRIKAIIATIFLVSAYWGIIDGIAIHGLKVWAFRPEHVTGLKAFGLPIEEWMLFVLSGGFIVPLILVFCQRTATSKRPSAR